MSTLVAQIWMTRDGGDVAEIPGGRLFLYPNLGSIQISYQSDPPASMTAEQIAHARNRSRPANRRYWELGAVAPGMGMPGSFADLAIAKTVIDRAAARTDHTIGSRLLGEHGFRVTGTDPYGGVNWIRSQTGRREIVVTNDHRVYARIEEYGLKTPQILMDIPLDNRVVARGVLEKPVSVHYVWPPFMADTDALAAMAVDALNLIASPL